jgi:hypothetical protein
VVDHIEFAHGMLERYEITTGSVVDLLKSVVSECCNVTQQSSFIVSVDDTMLMGRVNELVCVLRDTWRGHMDEEEEEDDQDLASRQIWVPWRQIGRNRIRTHLGLCVGVRFQKNGANLLIYNAR